MSKYVVNPRFELNTPKKSVTYEIMHMDKIVATVSALGQAKILNEQFMPYDMYLEESNDFDDLVNNLANFYYWCASRVLSLDRTYAKEIMNSLGVSQAVTDQDRAQISLSYHCVSLNDVYWVRTRGEAVTFEELNLYDNPLNEAIIPLPLKGKHLTVTNKELAPDLSTKGCFPKAWIRTGTEFRLLKDGGEDVVHRELVASKICQCFDVPQVAYEEYFYDGEVVTQSAIVTSKQYSMISKMAYDVYAINNDLDTVEECIRLDPIVYYGMNILDYLVGNTDRHPENWGFLVDNATNQPVSLYPLMDFNMSFQTYDKLDGANCQTVFPRKLTQREAAIEAVQIIGLRQIRDVDLTIFDGMDQEREMFQIRLAELKKYARVN